jgi:hypothetical protein
MFLQGYLLINPFFFFSSGEEAMYKKGSFQSGLSSPALDGFLGAKLN